MSLTALIALVIASPLMTVHPAFLHVYQSGQRALVAETLHPTTIGLLALALIAGLPAIGFFGSLVRAMGAFRGLRTLIESSRPATQDGVSYRIFPGDGVTVFTAGLARPTIFVSEGAEQILPQAHLRAALLHEQGHRVNHDIPWRLLLRAVGRGFAFVPGAARFVDAAMLRSECEADDFALRAGARRKDLFEAIAAAASGPTTPYGTAALADMSLHFRLGRLASTDPDPPLPKHPNGGFLTLSAATITPVLLAHLISVVALVCALGFRA